MKYKLILIKWIDAHSIDEWTSLQELREHCAPLEIRSVGWLVSEKNEHFLIVPHITNNDDPKGSGSITIPKSQIIERTVLSEVAQ